MPAKPEVDLIKVARLYYEQDKTQEEIAARLKISRPRVSRLLQQAREQGIVRITIVDPNSRHRELEQSLGPTFGLREAIVVPGEMETDEWIRPRLGQAAARYLETILRDSDLVGVGWGRTLHEIAAALNPPRRAHINVVPLLGGLGQISPSFQVHELARRMAEAFGGTWQSFYAPAIAESEEARASIVNSADIRRVIEQWHTLDVAIVGVGNVNFEAEMQMLFVNYLDAATQQRLCAAGAVGDICMRFFNLDGTMCQNGVAGVVGIDLDTLRQTRRVIGVAGGPNKIEAILGALRGRFLHILVTDETAARGVMELAHGG
jgi:DNA-binding transcriptional regulator LsrR (DeoR family)